MNAAGTGYVLLPYTRRVGFSVSMGVEYLPEAEQKIELYTRLATDLLAGTTQ